MKRLSLQWRITLLTALLIACACVCMNLLLYRTGATGMDALNGFMMQYQPGSEDSLTIEIPQEEMSSLLAHFSQEVYDAKVVLAARAGASLLWSPSSARPSLILSAAEL